MKLLLFTLSVIWLFGCVAGTDGSDSNPSGEAGYESVPALITGKIHALPGTICTGQVSRIGDGVLIQTLSINSINEFKMEMNYPDTELRFTAICDTGQEPVIKLEALYVHIQGISKNIQVSPLTTLAAAHYKFFESTTDVSTSIPLFIGFSNKSISEYFGVNILLPINEFPSYPVSILSESLYLNSINNSLLNFGYYKSGNTADSNSMIFLESVTSDLSSNGKLDGLTEIALVQEYLEIVYPSGFVHEINSYTYFNDFIKAVVVDLSRFITDTNTLTELLNWSVTRSESRTSITRNVEVQTLDTSMPSTLVLHSALNGVLDIRIQGGDDLLVLSVEVKIADSTYIASRSYDNLFELEVTLADEGYDYSDLAVVEVIISDFYANTTSTILDMSI